MIATAAFAAGLRLLLVVGRRDATEFIPDGKKHGLLGSFASIDRVITDKQLVMLLILDEAGKALAGL